MKKLMVFPGQGSQRVGMLADVPNHLLAQVTELTGYQLLDVPSTYEHSLGIQLAIFIKQVAMVEALKAKDIFPDLVAGHSIGAFAASVASGALSITDGIQLVYKRASLMEAAYPVDYGMAVVVGLLEQELAPLIASVYSEAEPLYIANKNAELQYTVSGKLTALEKLLIVAKQAGASKASLLKVPVPSHCPLMADVAASLTETMQGIRIATPACLYIANHTGEAVATAAEIAEDLACNVQYPVLWDRMTDIALERQMDIMLEAPPGDVLTKLVKAKDSHLKMINVDQIGIEGTLFLVKKWEGR